MQRNKTKKPIKRIRRVHREKWEDVRPELHKKFSELNINSCELGLDGCTNSMFLTFAHSLRRRKINQFEGKEHSEKMRQVARLCQSCHAKADALPHDVTYRMILNIINDRMETHSV